MKKLRYLGLALGLLFGFSLMTTIPVLAAPVVASVTETAFGTDTTNHYVNMPVTVDPGDLLIALFTNDGSATVATPDGWTQLASTANGAAIRLSVYYRIADGTEDGTTVNYVTSAAEQAAAQVYSITNWHGTTPPEISTAATGVTTRPNPASLSPAGWGVADTLWLAMTGQDRGDQSGTTAYPTYYTNGISTQSSEPATTGVCRTHSARRVLAAASEDPGAFTIPVAEEWVAFTVAVGPAPHNLATSSTEGGAVTEPGEGMFTYGEGTVVDLVAEADDGYRFDEWTGDVGTIADVYAAATTIIMNGDYSITANFVKQYNLVIIGAEGGSVVEPGEDIFTYDLGTVVDLVATPGEGHRFDEWTGDVSTIADVNAASTTITMNGNYSITANFVAQYDLMTNSTAGGNVTSPGEGLFPNCDAGTVIGLVATCDAGYRFVNWTGDVGSIADVDAVATNITMNGDYSITANFIKQYNLTILSTEGGSVAEPGEGVFTYDEETVVNLVATPDASYRFVEWTGDAGTIADVHAASTTIAMNGDYSIAANFVTQHDLTISSTAGGNVNTPGEGTFAYDEGTVVNIAATPDAGYRFVGWAGDAGTIADVHTATTTIIMNSDYFITAVFQITTPPPWGSAGGCFIATAAYGTPAARQIDILREFRDDVLLKSAVGSQFVALYYRFSPPVAEYIAGSELLRTLVRQLLVDPIVRIVEATGDIWRS